MEKYQPQSFEASLGHLYTQIGLAAGILVNYAIGSIPNFPYFYNSLVAAGIAAMFEILMVWLYETPRWLVSQGRVSEARVILQWLRGPGVQNEDEIRSNESTEHSDNFERVHKKKRCGAMRTNALCHVLSAGVLLRLHRIPQASLRKPVLLIPGQPPLMLWVVLNCSPRLL